MCPHLIAFSCTTSTGIIGLASTSILLSIFLLLYAFGVIAPNFTSEFSYYPISTPQALTSWLSTRFPYVR